MKTAVSLFSGCGGSDAGLHALGFDVLMANDILPYAKEVYLANMPETDYKVQDIREITSFPKADILVGCYPCQGFSQGGARDPGRGINYLYREFDRALRSMKPKAFVVENVSGMRRADNNQLLRNQLIRFRMAGYRVKFQELNAKDFGVAQDRKRVFFVGIRSDIDAAYEFPTPTHGVDAELNPFTTLRDAIGDLPEWPEGEFWTEKFHWYYLSRNRRCEWNGQSKTIVSHQRHMPLHPVSPEMERLGPDEWRFKSDEPARRFSYREAARLQGFKRDFVLPDTVKIPMKYKVVGNAVPPPLFEAVVGALPDIW